MESIETLNKYLNDRLFFKRLKAAALEYVNKYGMNSCKGTAYLQIVNAIDWIDATIAREENDKE
jgi:hypothetical protein